MTSNLPVLLPLKSLPRPPSVPHVEWTPKKYLTDPQPPPLDDMKITEQELINSRQLIDGKLIKKTKPRRTVDYNSGMGRWGLLLPPKAYPENASTSLCTKFVHTSTNKIRCPINVVTWTPEARRVLTGSTSGEFTLWNGLTFNFETILQAHDTGICAMQFTHSGAYLASTDKNGVIKYFEPNMNNLTAWQGSKSREPIRGLSFSPDDRRFATASDDSTIKIWAFEESREESTLTGHGWDVKCVQWHPTKGLLVSGSKDNTIKFWDPRTGTVLSSLHPHKNTVQAIAWSPNGDQVASASRDQTVRVFDIRAMKEFRVLKGHKKEVCSVAWHPVHPVLVSGGSEGSIIHWDVSTADSQSFLNQPNAQSQPRATLAQAHDSNVWCLAFHPLGHLLASGSNDHTTRFWSRERPGDSSSVFSAGGQKPPEITDTTGQDDEDDAMVPGMSFGQGWWSKPEENANDGMDTGGYGKRGGDGGEEEYSIPGIGDSSSSRAMPPQQQHESMYGNGSMHHDEWNNGRGGGDDHNPDASSTSSTLTIPSKSIFIATDTSFVLRSHISAHVYRYPIRLYRISTKSFVTRDELINISADHLKSKYASLSRPSEARLREWASQQFFSNSRYAILSHTWGSDELRFEDIQPGRPVASKGDGADKFLKFCDVAETEYDCDYVWIDTNCINKASSADLEESIRSMFTWYASAYVCIVYLGKTVHQKGVVESSKWFTRGWTLQELFAPLRLKFYVLGVRGRWDPLTTYHFDICWPDPQKQGMNNNQLQAVESAAGVDVNSLRNFKRDAHSAPKVFRWASRRQTTCPEDIAYCLIGILGVTMSVAYGEGADSAFFRLQAACAERSDNRAAFLWDAADPAMECSMFARHPRAFQSVPLTSLPLQNFQDIFQVPDLDSSFSLTNSGLRISVMLRPLFILKDLGISLIYADGKAVDIDRLVAKEDASKSSGDEYKQFTYEVAILGSQPVPRNGDVDLVLDSYPHWAGHLFDTQTHTPTDHTLRYGRLFVEYGTETDPGVDYTVAANPREAASFLPKADWRSSPVSPTPLAILSGPGSTTSSPVPSMSIQVTSFACGSVAIGVKMSHPLADARSLMLFMRHWACLYRCYVSGVLEDDVSFVRPFFEPSLLDAAASGNIDSPVVDESLIMQSRSFPGHRYDWLKSSEGCPSALLPSTIIPEAFVTNVSEHMRNDFDSGDPIPWDELDMNATIQHQLFHFTPAQLSRIYEATVPTEPTPLKISYLDALLANLWFIVNRVRYGAPSDQPLEVFLNQTLSLRGHRLSTSLPENFVGSPVLLARVSFNHTPSTTPSTIAQNIRAVLSSCDSTYLGAKLYDKAMESSPPWRIWHGYVGKRNLLVSSWIGEGAYELDFGGKGGDKNMPIYAEGVMPAMDGLIQLADVASEESVEGGRWYHKGVDVSMHLPKDIMEQVITDLQSKSR
ncbi:hypothetical protein ONZ45_g6325 [Pleurotus djamor]|nr:hypothetical protein ONZ45_g6325 [Pleurotus djamor]